MRRIQKLGLVEQVLGLGGRAVGIVGEEGERLVMKLKQRVGMAGQRVVPATGIPGPADVLVRQTVADRGEGLVGDQVRGGYRGGGGAGGPEKRGGGLARGGGRAV